MDQAFKDWWKREGELRFSCERNRLGENEFGAAMEVAWLAWQRPAVPLPSAVLLAMLAERGGAAAALGKAGLLFEAKGQDYNVGIKRDDYFPLGLSSYAQMVWVKALRLVSFAKTPRAPRHEDISETLLDCINYCAFAWDWMQRQRLVVAGTIVASNIAAGTVVASVNDRRTI